MNKKYPTMYVVYKGDKAKLYKCFKEIPTNFDTVCVIYNNYMSQLSGSILQKPYIAEIYRRIRGNHWKSIDSWYISEEEKNKMIRNAKLNELLENL